MFLRKRHVYTYIYICVDMYIETFPFLESTQCFRRRGCKKGNAPQYFCKRGMFLQKRHVYIYMYIYICMLRLFTFSKAPNVSEKQAAPRLCFNVENILGKTCRSRVSQTQTGLGLFAKTLASSAEILVSFPHRFRIVSASFPHRVRKHWAYLNKTYASHTSETSHLRIQVSFIGVFCK